jgi:hypothetical protein
MPGTCCFARAHGMNFLSIWAIRHDNAAAPASRTATSARASRSTPKASAICSKPHQLTSQLHQDHERLGPGRMSMSPTTLAARRQASRPTRAAGPGPLGLPVRLPPALPRWPVRHAAGSASAAGCEIGEHFRVCAGHRLGAMWHQDCQSVRVMASTSAPGSIRPALTARERVAVQLGDRRAGDAPVEATSASRPAAVASSGASNSTHPSASPNAYQQQRGKPG